jgi:phosphoglycerate kinase
MVDFRRLEDLKVAGKVVLVRVDYNVPMRDGQVTDATRIARSKETIADLTGRGARVVLLSHFGRPKGKPQAEMSLKQLLPAISRELAQEVVFAADCIGAEAEAVVAALADGQVALLENLRFHAGEEANDPAFVAALAKLGVFFVMDAFSAAHRAHASTDGIARRLPAAAGRLMQSELEHLAAALDDPERPLAAIVGGAKVSTKLDLLGNLIKKVDLLAIGGGMANTFLFAQGHEVGASLCEKEMAGTAQEILSKARGEGCEILLPRDLRVARALAPGVESRDVILEDLGQEEMILDIGPASAADLARRVSDCATLVWNGPLGCFETPPFDFATNLVAREVAALSRAGRILSVAGGGDTLSALAHASALDGFSYASTAGGAFLEWLEGKTLPGVKALEDSLLTAA